MRDRHGKRILHDAEVHERNEAGFYRTDLHPGPVPSIPEDASVAFLLGILVQRCQIGRERALLKQGGDMD